MSSNVETEVDIQSEICDYQQYKQRHSLALLKRSGATFPKMLGKLAEQERAEKEVFRGTVGCTTRNAMSAWLCDQVKIGEIGINTAICLV